MDTIETKAQYVRRGGDLGRFSLREILAIQEYALEINDIQLYDSLESFLNHSKQIP